MMRLGLVFALTIFLTGCAYFERRNAEHALVECWGATRVSAESGEFDATFEAILVGAPQHGYGIWARTDRCPDQRVKIWSSHPQIEDALVRLAERSFEAFVTRATRMESDQPGTMLRIDARVVVLGVNEESENIELDLVGARRFAVMSGDEARRSRAQYP